MADPIVAACPTCAQPLKPGFMNKASLGNSLNWYECSSDTCDYETSLQSTLDNND